MAEHATLSPSSAERWLACPASVRLSAGAEDETSAYAEEGTLAHTIAEIEASRRFGLVDDQTYESRAVAWSKQVDPDTRAEMLRYAVRYGDLLADALADHPMSHLLLEQRVYTGVPGCWGTADAIIVSPRHVRIVDYKYGKGIEVCAEDNPQLMLYALGALEMFGDVLGDTEIVEWTVIQPRLGTTTTDSMLASELRHWRDHVVKPVAAEALAGSTRFAPSLTTCRWCPVAGTCRPRAEHLTRLDFGHPELMDADELAEHLARLPEMRNWISSVEETALRKAYSLGEEIPGWKVVQSGGKRSIKDHEDAIDRLVRAGYDRDQVQRVQARPLGELEKVVGKDELPSILGASLTKSEGRPSLVGADDPRPSIDRNQAAGEDFTNV